MGGRSSGEGPPDPPDRISPPHTTVDEATCRTDLVRNSPRLETAVDQALRLRLIDALKSRSWESSDAERAATRIEALYEAGTEEWKVVLWEVAGGEGSLFFVARRVEGPSVFDSPREVRARDVAGALNEIEADSSASTDAR
jgi:hypothetical protein